MKRYFVIIFSVFITFLNIGCTPATSKMPVEVEELSVELGRVPKQEMKKQKQKRTKREKY